MFGKYTPGLIILNNVKFNEEPAFCFLFKVDKEQLILEAKENSRSSPYEVDMVIFSLLQKYDFNPNASPSWRTLDVKLKIKEVVDMQKVRLQYQFVFQQSPDTLESSEGAKFRDLDSQWHFMCVRVKKSMIGAPTMEFYMDSFERDNKNNIQV